MTIHSVSKGKGTQKWLITGGCGFIGTSLISQIIQQPENSITVLDNLSMGTREELSRVCHFIELDAETLQKDYVSLQKNQKNSTGEKPDGPYVKLVVGDICNYGTCLACCINTDIVVHLAANTGVLPSIENPRRDMEINVMGTLNLLESARINEVGQFVFASSGAPLGECNPPIHEEMPPHPLSPYGASKLAGEAYCSAYFGAYGLRTIGLRFSNVYGPGSTHKDSLIAKFIKRAIKGEVCKIYGTGEQTRDFIYIDDLVDAILKSSESELGGEIFQIATSREHSVNEVAEIMKKTLDSKLGIKMEIEYEKPQKGEIIRTFSDTSKAERQLRWKAKVDLLQGIQNTIQWFEKLMLL